MNTSIYERARQLYESEECPRSLDLDILLHLRYGHCYSSDDYLVLGRPVVKDAPHCLVVDPSVVFDTPDCWLVYLAVGRLSDIIDLAPYQLPWFAWQRDNVLHYYRRENVERIAKCITMMPE